MPLLSCRRKRARSCPRDTPPVVRSSVASLVRSFVQVGYMFGVSFGFVVARVFARLGLSAGRNATREGRGAGVSHVTRQAGVHDILLRLTRDNAFQNLFYVIVKGCSCSTTDVLVLLSLSSLPRLFLHLTRVTQQMRARTICRGASTSSTFVLPCLINIHTHSATYDMIYLYEYVK